MNTLIAILQILCILATATGIYIEYKFNADMGFLLITAGSLIFAVTTKLNKIRLRRRIKQLTNSHKTQHYERNLECN